MLKLSFVNERQLLDAIHEGGRREDRAITYLLRENQGKIRQFIKSRNGSEADADDVLQEGVTELVLNVRRGVFKGESKVSTYLFAICKGIWYKRFQKITRQEGLKEVMKQDEEETYSPRLAIVSRELEENVTAVLDMLKTNCREVLLLWGAFYSMQEIANTMNYKTPQIAMNKKSKCLKELKTLLAERPYLRQQLKSSWYE